MSESSICLGELFSDLGLEADIQIQDIPVLGITQDSRQVKEGYIFVAIKGLSSDGHNYIGAAIEKGAVLVVVEHDIQDLDLIKQFKVDSTSKFLGQLSSAYYGFPSDELQIIGITGTNGKTSVSTLCHQLFTGLGFKCGLIGTVEILVGQDILPSTHTTPGAVKLHETFRKMVDAGCEYVFMEVSSHALIQDRTYGINFKGGVFTNISHDHLDYHGDMLSYINAKKILFDQLQKSAFALVNIDDKRGMVMVQNTKAEVYRYSLKSLSEFKAKILENSLQGLHLTINNTELYAKMVGAFNAYNLLTVFGISQLLGVDEQEALVQISSLKGAPGRFEIVSNESSHLLGIVDYAHTPDALLNVLKVLQPIRHLGHKIILVFGCGGDRDGRKRPVMGEIAAELSDHVIVTDDNPRTESPDIIREQIIQGVSPEFLNKIMDVPNRRQAIRIACRIGNEKDIVLVAGKGHENYQEINGERTYFDDREVLREALEV